MENHRVSSLTLTNCLKVSRRRAKWGQFSTSPCKMASDELTFRLVIATIYSSLTISGKCKLFCWAAGSNGWLFCLDGCWSCTVGLQRRSVTELEINSPPGGRKTLTGFYYVFPLKEPNCFHSSVQSGPNSGSWPFDIRREAVKEI